MREPELTTGKVLDATERIAKHAKRGKGITLSKAETKIVATMLSQFDIDSHEQTEQLGRDPE